MWSFCVFFFKQKTAYEMRISDWSSDVCSSDLTDRNDALGIAQMMRLGWFRMVHVKGIANQRLRTLLSNRKLLKRKLIDLQNHIRGALRAYGQIGRPA